MTEVADEFVATSLENFEEQDHRMYWAASGIVSGTVTMPEAAPFYFESEEKFDRLRDIKACVDPDEVFQGLMGFLLRRRLRRDARRRGRAGRERRRV